MTRQALDWIRSPLGRARPLSEGAIAARVFALGWLAVVLMGADDTACTAEYQPGDGRDAAWPVGEIPEADGPSEPMSCEWLEGNNCWKEFAQKVLACAPEGVGEFDEERATCTFSDGSELQLAGSISDPADNATQFPIVNHRIVDADGEPCLTATILDVGHHAFDVQGEVYVTESLSLTDYRVICPDGSSFSNQDSEATCEDFGFRWLIRRAPGYTLTCNGGNDTCAASIWGANDSGDEVVATCRDPYARGTNGMGGGDGR